MFGGRRHITLLLLLLLEFTPTSRTWNGDLKSSHNALDIPRRTKRGLNQIVPRLTPVQMIMSNGYPAENHLVTTEDGYILELHRIPRGIKYFPEGNRKSPPIFLMHCILCSSADWLANYPDKALGYMLADSGYDVWMGNVRGNTFSRRHIKLSAESREFWQFSFTEVAIYDLPNSIDYILNVTKSSRLNYLGFSFGTTVLFAMLSEKPEYNNKITVAALMGPSVFMMNSEGIAFGMSPFVNVIQKVLENLRMYELLSARDPIVEPFTLMFCRKNNPLLNHLCISFLSTVIDVDQEKLNWKFIPTIFSHLPAGTSLNTLVHYYQNRNAASFRHFDYGPYENRMRYGSKVPPEFNLNYTHIPVGLFVGKGDKLINMKDVNRLISELPNVVTLHIIPAPIFVHFDFLWSKDADQLLYKDVIEYIDKFN